MPPSLTRISNAIAPADVITAVFISTLAPPWAHALAGWLRDPSLADGSWSGVLTIAAVALGPVAAAIARCGVGRRLAVASVAAFTLLAAMALHDRSWLQPALSLLPVALASGELAAALRRRLPVALQRFRGLPLARVVGWAVLALLAVVQLARLSTWMGDPESDWFLTTRHPFWAKHECLPAYIYGAELALRGEDNVYDPAHYPGLNPAAQPHTAVSQMTVEDPFQYPPPFLLIPGAVLQFSHDYPAIRATWFALQTSAFIAVSALLALWVGGVAGRIALYLLPLSLGAFPVLHSLQYGQFHLAAVVMSVAAMWAFSTRRTRLGAVLLAAATMGKLFPGVLGLWLLGRRRFAEVGWTAAVALAMWGTTWAVFGAAPSLAFFGSHLPRLQSGAAFAFGEAWPEVADMILVANQGVYGLLLKLEVLGVPGIDRAFAVLANRLYAVGLVVFAVYFGMRSRGASRESQAISWLALLGLASLMSTGAFADYVPLATTWLMTLLVPRMRRPVVGLALGAVWLAQYTLAFTTPLGDWFDPAVLIPGSACAAAGMLAALCWTLQDAAGARHAEPRLRLEGLPSASARWEAPGA